MNKTYVNEFAVGKTVAKDIYNRRGTLLLKIGSKITLSIVERLVKNDIMFVWTMDNDESQTG